MQMIIVPPGAVANAHYHLDFETAIFIVEGQVETCYGFDLDRHVVNGPGDFLSIPPFVPHQPRNTSTTHTARAIVCRNDPHEQEDVVLYPKSEAQAFFCCSASPSGYPRLLKLICLVVTRYNLRYEYGRCSL
jgi:uncharacterized RmlC-like cupin family protein